METSNLAILFALLPYLLSLDRVTCLHAGWLLCKYVLNRQYLIKQLKFLLRHLLVLVVHDVPVELCDVLESIHHERF